MSGTTPWVTIPMTPLTFAGPDPQRWTSIMRVPA